MSIPERIPCKCGDLEGVLVLKKALIEVEDASGVTQRVQPTEFEQLGGRGAAKKWKASIKVGPGVPGFEGKEIGTYLRDKLGVDIYRGAFQPSISPKPHASTVKAHQSSQKNPSRPKSLLGREGSLGSASFAHEGDAHPKQHFSKQGSSYSTIVPLSKSSTSKKNLGGSRNTPSDLLHKEGSIKSVKSRGQHPGAKQGDTRRPVAERIQDHSKTHAMLYEPPLNAGVILESNPTVRVKSRTTTEQWYPQSMPGSDCYEDIEISQGRPRKLCSGIIDMSTVSAHNLMRMCMATGNSDETMTKRLLSEVPTVPTNKLSVIPVLDKKKKVISKKGM